ncbi:hypothetical protein Val02_62610 [Virgisporangium aliadipatigenens]|uniref:YopA central domain-containing protein n=1 Tax=Virgisporangium aliadipatigenens TaxID=741659 RepID=A0A8J4DSL8_9ACTN|nr:hypothetical protein [Virgisporangium aliadipatigenens]GIJ49375.1 hypothetical protein Val02_62610 [Virgisporangium aliadipatigenens]
MIEEWQRRFPGTCVDPQLRPVYPFDESGSSIIIYDGNVGGVAAHEQRGSVELSLNGKPSLRWSVEPDPDNFSVSMDDVELGLRRGSRDWMVSAYRTTPDSGWFNRAELATPDAQLQRVIVHWINLPDIQAYGRIATENDCWNGRWQTEVDGWRVTLDRRHDHAHVTEKATAPVFVLTHVMEVRRVGGDDFDVASVRQVLECLRVCFSFAFGRWVAPALPVGFDSADEVVWEEWTAPICDPYRKIGAAWLYRLRADDLMELVERALPAFLDPDRPGATRFQMVLAVQAVETGFLEQRIMSAFPALENLAWITLALSGLVTRSEYRNSKTWPGERRLRRLLELAQVPIDIDKAELPALADFAAAEKLDDGPAAVVKVRNRLIHPKSPHDEIYQLDGLVKDAWFLSRHYLTLLILHSIGYQGSYVKLFPPGGSAGDAKPVPWAQLQPRTDAAG